MEGRPRGREACTGRGSSRTRDDRGWTTLWILGLCFLLFGLGGLSLDLWRAFGERRSLAGIADAAAVAGANGVDETAYRASAGRNIVLDPARAEALANQNLRHQTGTRALAAASVVATPERIRVRLSGEVDLTLLRLLAGGRVLRVTVSASAGPRGSP